MKYDLVVVGGGPGGLMAAKTAAEDGLKVLIIERKRDITSTPRTDVSIFYWKFIIPDEYIEPVMVEMGTGTAMQGAESLIRPKTKFNFLGPDFSIDYTGPVIPYYNYIKLSPAGHQVHCIKDDLWGFYFSRETILADLLTAVQKTKAEVLTETLALGVENDTDGVRVRVRTKSGEQTLEAKKAIAADGIASTIVESLGLNQNRTSRQVKIAGYILVGVEPDIYDHGAWLSCDIPSISSMPVYMGFHAEAGDLNLRHLITYSEEAIEKFMRHSRYAPWFRHARLVRKTAFAGSIYMPVLREPVAGNVLIIGDAISQESFIQGAIACGYQGAKATLKELGGQKGYPEYINWLHKAFAFFALPDHFKIKQQRHIFTMALPNDEDIDYVFRLMQEQGKTGHPAGFVAENPELLKDERPGLYERLKKAIEEVNRLAVKGWG
ncbi:MAG: FAD-dependent monooxygenase [Dehalococcoidales bacterium]